MSDEIQAPGADTPEPNQTDTTDWEKRYNDLQPEYTRKSQRLSQLESDPNALVEWVQQYHPDLLADDDTGEVEQEYDDTEDDPRWAKLQELEAWKAEQDQRQDQAEAAAEWAGWEEYVKGLATKEGVELSGRDIKALKLDSAGKNGRPVDPEKAAGALTEHIADLRAYEEKLLERAKTKRKRAPQPPGDGSTATQTPELDTHQDRVAFMTQRWADQNAD